MKWAVAGYLRVKAAPCGSPVGGNMFNILGLIVVGLVIGVIARLIKPGRQNLSLLWTFLLGLAGALIGGIIASWIGTGDVFELTILGFIVAVLAAIVMLRASEGFAGSQTRFVEQ